MRQLWLRARGLREEDTGFADNLEEFGDIQPFAHIVGPSFVGLDEVSAADPILGEYDPPDTTVAKSDTRVLEAANTAVRLFDASGTVIDTKVLADFFSVPQGVYPVRLLLDPKTYFDRNATNQRFYLTAIMDGHHNPGVSKIHLAVSRSPNPPNLDSSSWCRYEIDGIHNPGTPDASWADFPQLGVGANAVIISSNQYKFGGPFTFAILRVLNKLTLANNASACPPLPTVFEFQPASATLDRTIYTLQPAQHYTSPSSFPGADSPAYLLSTYANAPNSKYRLWRLRNVASGNPILDLPVDVRGNYTYDTPPMADVKDGQYDLITGDASILQVAGIGDGLWAAHTTACNLGKGAAEACVRVVRIIVGEDRNEDPSGSMNQQYTLGATNVFFWTPSIAVNLTNHVAIAFLRSSANEYFSTWWTGKSLSASAFEPATSLTSGTCQFAEQLTGDYNGAQTDPAGVTLWLGGARFTTVGSACSWETRIIQVTPP